jgi:hypothetical protein
MMRSLRVAGEVRVAGNSSNRARIRKSKIYTKQSVNVNSALSALRMA